MKIKDNTTISIYPESNPQENATITTDCYQAKISTVSQDTGYTCHKVLVISQGDAFLKTISGEGDALKLLLKAVNNRTIERDYFKLYCEMLDSSITEEEFDKLIELNETGVRHNSLHGTSPLGDTYQ
jgi:hypothetical protein